MNYFINSFELINKINKEAKFNKILKQIQNAYKKKKELN